MNPLCRLTLFVSPAAKSTLGAQSFVRSTGPVVAALARLNASVRVHNEAGVVFSVVSIARTQRRRPICSLFSIDTESSKLKVEGSSPSAPTICFQRLTKFFGQNTAGRLGGLTE